jgi:hypothetical protein
VDVHPDGAAFRVSFGVLNLAHRAGNAEPRPMRPGVAESVQIALDAAGYRFAPGHRIRLSLSTAYWPMVLPPPTAVTATIYLDGASLVLPVRPPSSETAALPEPKHDGLLPTYRELAPAQSTRRVERDLRAGLTRYIIHEDTGAQEHPATKLTARQVRSEIWSIDPEDPLSMTGVCHWIAEMSRGDWRNKTLSSATLACTAEDWLLSASVDAFEGEAKVHSKAWSRRIRRDCM